MVLASTVEGRLAHSSQWYDNPPPFTGFQVASRDVKSWPLETVGALFFTARGLDYRCSAASVGEFAVWTAGHCVHSGSGGFDHGGSWSKNVVFVPAYDGRKSCPGPGCPAGVWESDQLWTLSFWADAADSQFDVGGVIVKRNDGESLAGVVGALGVATDMGYVQHWSAFGYPGEPPFNGNRMQTCQASTSSLLGGSYPMVGFGCDMTRGSSGGPLVLTLATGPHVNGNVSISVRGYKNELFSPYFGSCEARMIDALRASTPGSPADEFSC